MNKEIQNIVNQVVENYNPEKVILFGSRANGNPDDSSDIDLAVIKNTQDRFVDRLKQISKAVKTWKPVDILVYTPQEWQTGLDNNHYFVKEIAQTGKVLYEK